MVEKEVGHVCVDNILHNWEGSMDCGHFKVTKIVKWCPPSPPPPNNWEGFMDCDHFKMKKILKGICFWFAVIGDELKFVLPKPKSISRQKEFCEEEDGRL